MFLEGVMAAEAQRYVPERKLGNGSCALPTRMRLAISFDVRLMPLLSGIACDDTHVMFGS